MQNEKPNLLFMCLKAHQESWLKYWCCLKYKIYKVAFAFFLQLVSKFGANLYGLQSKELEDKRTLVWK